MNKFFTLFCFINCFAFAQQISWLDTLYYGGYTTSRFLCSDSQQNIFLCGGLGSSQCCDPFGFFVHKYSSSGQLLASDTVSCPYNTNIAFGGTAIDSQDNFYVCVRSFSRFKYKNVIFDPQTWLIRSNPQGQVTGSIALNYEMPLSMIVDNSNNIYVSNVALGGGNSSVIKFNSFLQVQNTYPIGGHIALDSLNNLYIMTNELRKYNSTGQLLWTKQNIPNDSKLTVDPSGNSYVISRGTFVEPSNFQKIDAQGNSVWSSTLTIDASYAIGNFTGGIYLAGIQANNQIPYGVEFRKYDNSGNMILSASFPSEMGSTFVKPTCIEANPFGVYIGARTAQGSWSYLIKMSDPVLTGINPKKSTPISNLMISPNPSCCIFNITYTSEANAPVKLGVFDPLGKLVYTKEIKNFNGELKEQVNLTGFSKGVYILQLNSDDFKQTRRLVVE